MKYATLFGILIICSYASLMTSRVKDTIHKNLFLISHSEAKPNPREDIKYCGLYESECLSFIISMKSDIKLLGMMHKNPVYMQYGMNFYFAEKCSEEVLFQRVTFFATITPQRSVDKVLILGFEKATVLFATDEAFASYTCSEPLKSGVEYDVSALQCIDEDGTDPFEDIKAIVGTSVDQFFTFNEDSITLKDDTSTIEYLIRKADTGCTCASEITNSITKRINVISQQKYSRALITPVKDESLKYCGSYQSPCENPTGLLAQQEEIKLIGMMHKNPVYFNLGSRFFMAPFCNEAIRMMDLWIGGPITILNEQVDYAVSFDRATFIAYNEVVAGLFECSEPLKAGVEYDIMKLDCKDSSTGEDPFGDFKKLIGQSGLFSIEFYENKLVIVDGGSFERVNDVGCTCSLRS